MAKQIQVITFSSNRNEQMFERVSATNLSKDAVVIVPDTHYAVLIRDGVMMDTLNPGRHNVFDAASERKCASVQVEVIYMSRTVKLSTDWGTAHRIVLRDEETNLPYSLGMCGKFEVQINNPRKVYLELIGVERNFTLDILTDRIRDYMVSRLGTVISDAMEQNSMAFDSLAVTGNKEVLSNAAFKLINEMMDKAYGLKLFSFIIQEIIMDQEAAIHIIEARKRLKREKEEKEEQEKRERKEREEEEKRERREREALEREDMKDDKNWQREQFLLELKQKDYDKYLEVCKAIGWEPKEGGSASRGARFCSNCGFAYQPSDKFCPECGKPVGDTKRICPKCRKENNATAKFCSDCGERL